MNRCINQSCKLNIHFQDSSIRIVYNNRPSSDYSRIHGCICCHPKLLCRFQRKIYWKVTKLLIEYLFAWLGSIVLVQTWTYPLCFPSEYDNSWHCYEKFWNFNCNSFKASNVNIYYFTSGGKFLPSLHVSSSALVQEKQIRFLSPFTLINIKSQITLFHKS